ncbi:membrane hypothetical protein [Gammaproteobacteria bacterium]
MFFRQGVLDALCIPGLTLFGANVGIGVLAHSLNVSFSYSVMTTVLGFSLSGQAVIITGAVAGTALLPLLISATAANIRLLPLSAGVCAASKPLSSLKNILLAAVTAATAWSIIVPKSRTVPLDCNIEDYALGVASTLWFGSVLSTGLGWLCYGHIPLIIESSLAFLTAIYFCCMMVGESARSSANATAAIIGTVFTIPLSYLMGAWGLVMVGILGAASTLFVMKREGKI